MELSIQTAYQDEPEYGTWRGYRLIAADGSGIRLPSSEEIVSEFGHGRLAAWDVDKQTLAEKQLPEVVTQMRSLNQDGLLFIYNRGYPSVKLIQQYYDLEVDFIFRLQTRNYSKLWEQILSGGLDFDFILENKKLENKIKGQKVRVIVLALANGETEVLITSLFD